ncbi:hypothetical protein [Actinocorallia herbida]|nr:hypothetical protein [Actinocorallia herbida]
MTQSAVVRFECGGIVPLAVLDRLAAALGAELVVWFRTRVP